MYEKLSWGGDWFKITFPSSPYRSREIPNEIGQGGKSGRRKMKTGSLIILKKIFHVLFHSFFRCCTIKTREKGSTSDRQKAESLKRELLS